MYIKRNITFSLDTKTKNGVLKTENVPIRMRVTFACKRVDFSMGYSIDMDKWDAEKQRVKSGCTNRLKISASQINADLNACASEMENIFRHFEMEETLPTPQMIKDAFNSRFAPPSNSSETTPEEKQLTFYNVYDIYVKEQGVQRNWTSATFQKMSVQRKHLIAFDSKLTFEKLDHKGLNKYLAFLRDKLNLCNSTILKQFDFLKWFLNWAVDHGYTDMKAYKTYHPVIKSAKRPVIYLTYEEQLQLEKFEIPKGHEYLEKVRDVFLFCCVTSLRYSDVANLRRNNIYDNHIEFVTVKTTDSLSVPLTRLAKAILKKYEDVAFPNNHALPVISNQKMNDYLKILAKMAGLDRPYEFNEYRGQERKTVVKALHDVISTHCARKSFICRCVALNINPDTIMSMTGHKDHRSMRPYIAVSNKVKEEALKKFDL
ncbi:MAG: site-specific integrase [Bacteroidales bacterium]|nr:site-specific integrase [Bacteroidales bacterium]